MSFHRIRAATNHDPEPEEPASGLEVGQSRTEGTVEVRRVSVDLYVAECMCGMRRRHGTVNAVNWITFTHNRNRIKHGCPPNPIREEV